MSLDLYAEICKRGSGGPQKPSSWLSEGVRDAFTINTEVGEETLYPPPPHLGATPLSRGNWCGHRPVYLEFLIVTVLVTLGRQSSCRVGL